MPDLFLNDWYMYHMAVNYGLVGVSETFYEPWQFFEKDHTFRMANIRDSVNVLVQFDGQDIEDEFWP